MSTDAKPPLKARPLTSHPAVRSASPPIPRLWEQAKPYRLHLAGIVAFAFLSTPFALLLPLPLKLVVDNILNHHPAPALLTRIFPAVWLQSTVDLLGIAISFLLLLG